MSGKKNRCHGRNKRFCEKYKLSHRREHNKLLRLRKHLSRHPDDDVAKEASRLCKAVIGTTG